MSQVIIGMDPHKRSATIEVMAADETVVGGGRYGTGAAGCAAMLVAVRRWPDRVWAIEGCRGTGRYLASRLVAEGEQVVDVPPKLSARTRVFTSGQGRKTDAADAHAVALAATRMRRLRPVTGDARLEVLRVLADRRGQQRCIQVGGLAAATGQPAQRGAVGGLTLAEQKIVRLTLNPLTVLETERPGARSPPPAGRLSPALTGLEIIAGRVLGRAAVHLLPDVVRS